MAYKIMSWKNDGSGGREADAAVLEEAIERAREVRKVHAGDVGAWVDLYDSDGTPVFQWFHAQRHHWVLASTAAVEARKWPRWSPP